MSFRVKTAWNELSRFSTLQFIEKQNQGHSLFTNADCVNWTILDQNPRNIWIKIHISSD